MSKLDRALRELEKTYDKAEGVLFPGVYAEGVSRGLKIAIDVLRRIK